MTSGDKQQQSERLKSGLPAWAKVLIGLVIVVIVGGAALLIGGVILFQNVLKQAQDPAAIARVAQSIAAFPEPLPAGYKFAMGMDLAGIKTLSVEHEADKQMIILMSLPKKDTRSARQLVDELVEKGIKTTQASAKFQEVKTRGEETVAGESMPYIVGSMTDNVGNKFEGLVACIVSKKKDETIFVYGIEKPGEPYHLDSTMNLLKSVKSI